ncbi:MAG: peptidase, partial [Pedosphaera sp.]|nr:peptidase [Pedosphaera sp.]
AKWISYSKDDALLRPHVFVKSLTNGEEQMIENEEFLSSSGSKWTPDGKKLVFLAGFGGPAMSSLNRSTMQLYSLTLTPIEKNPDEEKEINTEAQAEAAPETPRFRRGAGANSPSAAPSDGDQTDTAETNRRPRSFGANTRSNAPVEVKIVWDGMQRRFKKLTSMSGSVFNVVPAPDSHSLAFVAMSGSTPQEGGGGPGLYTILDDGSRLTRVGTAAPPSGADDQPRGRGGFGGGGFGDVQWSKDSRNIYYLQGGEIYSVPAPAAPADDSASASSPSGRMGGRGFRGGAGAASATPASDSASTPRRIAFTVRMEVNQIDERHEVFQEAWNTMKNRFYDRKMHGVDWAAAKTNYQSLLGDIADQEELHNVIMQMIGELNASHTGISGGGNADQATESVQTRYPGFEMEPDASGRFKISYIYKNGPADHDYVKLAVGNYILAVNGKELTTGQNYWRLFNLVPGRKFDFSVNSQPDMKGSWTVSIDPLSATAQGNLEYDRWVNDRKDMVRKISKGQVGYLHIKAMDSPSYDKFQRDLLQNLDKKALIIDERFNGGGGIDQELLIILNQRKKYESYRSRDSVEINRPSQAFFGPLAVLENERSASNAEMFPEGFRELGLGKVIGVPTYGAVIGTGAFKLLDGSTLRTPGVGVYTAKGQDFENYGVPPDVYIDNTPADFLAGHDRQIEKAVEILLGETK